MEDAWNMAESMLSDVLVSNAYEQFINQNSILFKDKVRQGFYSLSSTSIPKNHAHRSSWMWAAAVDC